MICSNITQFFKKSHFNNNLLVQIMEKFRIQGGGLKSYCKTRWTSVYETLSAIVRLQRALEEIAINHSEEINDKNLKKQLKNPNFYFDIKALVQVLQPIKNAIKIMEGDKITMADIFIQMIYLAYKIKHFNNNNMLDFKKYINNMFNKRWEEFDFNIYLLAYFLHPAYRSKYYFID